MPATKVKKIKWVKLGLKLFSIKGTEGINVELMASKLNCNKSSFYWHFKSKEKFLNEIINYWYKNSTVPIINQIDKENNPKEKFEKFIRQSFKNTSRNDLMHHLRKLSQNDIKIKELLNDLNAQRLIYISSLISDLGYSKTDAVLKSEVLMNFYVGWIELTNCKASINEEDINHAIDLIKTFIKF